MPNRESKECHQRTKKEKARPLAENTLGVIGDQAVNPFKSEPVLIAMGEVLKAAIRV